ncbi:Hypothetical protein PHPALM_19869 [Phytophthora palmivora]|uniref:Uncharacterized protein n=1 Tax=Phytophthora palmivora TaxID=4796 RepID=A0A2P4XGA8_9STRA|nr:Hypothetical protein PHPALM_19869 [Phytophthora palmivora]
MVQQLYKRHPAALKATTAFTALKAVCAASSGHFDVVDFLYVSYSEKCSPRVIDIAASFGHLKVVEWMYEYCDEKCSSDGISIAAKNILWG